MHLNQYKTTVNYPQMKNNSPEYQLINNLFSTMYCIVLFNNHIFASSSTLKKLISKFKTMKTLSNSLGFLLVILIMNTSNAANVVPIQKENNTDKVEHPITSNGFSTSPGQILVVNLPEVEIVATRLDTHIVKGQYIGGKLMASVDLPAVEIIGQKMNSNQVRTIVINGELMVLAELPLVEITENFPVNNLHLASKSGLPIINLNEVLIVENSIAEEDQIAMQSEQDKTQEVDFTALAHTKDVYSMLMINTTKNTMNHVNSEWFYITLQKCGIHITGEHMYSIITQSRVIATDALRNQLTQLINN